MNSFLIKFVCKKTLYLLMHYFIAIIVYRCVCYIYLFYNPKLLDENVLDHFTINNNNPIILQSTILNSVDTNGNSLEALDYWKLIKYSFFLLDFYPTIEYVNESNGIISVSLSGYHELTWKYVNLDTQMRVVSVNYFRKTP